jgi:hypothetical protein
MNIFEKIAQEATAHLPPEPAEVSQETPEERALAIKALVKELELEDAAQLMRLARVAGWTAKRFATEREVMGLAIRFREAVVRGHMEAAWRDETGVMAMLLRNGPLALSGSTLAALTSMVKDRRLDAIARGYEPAKHGGRLVLGPTGIGKSVAGVAALRRGLGIKPMAYPEHRDASFFEPKRRYREVYCRALDLPNARLAQSLGKGEADLVDAAKQADFLVLDDVGWESRRAGADDVVVEVITTRYDLGKPTYATTGLKLDGFIGRYGEVVVRKLTEAGGLPGRVVDCWGQS